MWNESQCPGQYWSSPTTRTACSTAWSLALFWRVAGPTSDSSSMKRWRNSQASRISAIPVDVFGGSAQLNAVAALSAMRWLRQGGVLVAFPAGEVSAISGVPGPVTDRKWSDGIVRIAASSEAQIVRVFISGRNSLPFQLAGLAHPSMRTVLLGRELLNKKGYRVEVAVGNPLAPDVEHHDGEYLKRRTYLLQKRAEVPRKSFFQPRMRDLAKSCRTRAALKDGCGATGGQTARGGGGLSRLRGEPRTNCPASSKRSAGCGN